MFAGPDRRHDRGRGFQNFEIIRLMEMERRLPPNRKWPIRHVADAEVSVVMNDVFGKKGRGHIRSKNGCKIIVILRENRI